MSGSGWRKGHGRAAKLGQGLVWETCPPDELPALPPGSGTDPNQGRDDQGRIRDPELARRLARLRHVRPDFVRAEVVCTPEFRPFNERRREWTRRRVAELHNMTGGVSAAVGAQVRAAGWAVAFGEFLAAKAAGSGDADLMDQATRILAKASVESAKAYELAVREGRIRPATDPHARLLEAFGEPEPDTPDATSEPPTGAAEQGSRGQSTPEGETRSGGEYDVSEGSEA